jgi:hypothetical protein
MDHRRTALSATDPVSRWYPARRLLGSDCLGKVYPYDTQGVRQVRCLNKVFQRIVRRTHAQIYRHRRQKHMPGPLSGK